MMRWGSDKVAAVTEYKFGISGKAILSASFVPAEKNLTKVLAK